MVSCDKILEAVRKHNADAFGLSGLITPSLDEMIHNAQEMQKGELKIPLLIGGATTSRAHTAIKIAPHYEHGVVQVADASLVVNACNDLMQEGKRENFIKELKDKQEKYGSSTKIRKATDSLPWPIRGPRESRSIGTNRRLRNRFPSDWGLAKSKPNLRRCCNSLIGRLFSGLGNYGASIRTSLITKSLGMKPRNCMIAPKNSSIGF